MKQLILPVLAVLTFGLIIVTTVKATNNHCEHNCWTPSPTPHSTWTPRPTKSPEPSQTPEPSETPVETPVPTEQPTIALTQAWPAYAPTQALCPALEDWIPQIKYVGFTHNSDGSYTFTYILKSVETQNPTFLIWYGPTPEKVNSYPLIVHGENKTVEVSITQEQSTNWIKVWHYAEPGCFGKNPSPITN